MFVAKSQNVCQYWCSAVLRHASVRQLADGEYRKTSIPNNDVQYGFAVEDSCGFKVFDKRVMFFTRLFSNLLY